MTWRPQSVRAFVAALVAAQTVQAGRFATDGFAKSYWLVDYAHGFVRRGLAGAALSALVGRQTNDEVVAAAWAVALLAFAALLMVLVQLLRSPTPALATLAIIFAASPFGLDYVLFQRRPDELAIPLLVGLGFALTRLERRLVPICACIGVLFAALVFVHEAVVLVATPAAVLMVVVVLGIRGTDRAKIIRVLLFLGTPVVVAVVAVTVVGPASAATVAALRADGHGVPLGPITVFDYLGDSVRTSFDLVRGFPVRVLLTSFALGTALTGVQVWCITRWVGARAVMRSTTVTRDLFIAALCFSGAGAAVLFAIGVDWVRWFAALGSALLIVTSFAVVAHQTGDDRPPTVDHVRVPWSVVAVAVYLTAMAPLPPFTFPKDALRLLVLKQ